MHRQISCAAADPVAVSSATRVGRLVGVTEGGRALVACSASGPVLQCKTVVGIDEERLRSLDAEPIQVLLVFENDDPSKPVIVGLIHETVSGPQAPAPVLGPNASAPAPVSGPNASAPAPAGAVPERAGHSAVVDGRRVVLEGQDEVELRCGRSSIKLKRNGQVVIRGAEIVSRASGRNKIRGASVNIN